MGQQWDECFAVDVLKNIEILKICKTHDIIPVYISSDFVFDGKKGNYSESDSTNPLNGYGKIKAQIENYIKEQFESYLIIRTGKVFGVLLDDNTLINSIVNDLKKDNTSSYSTDQVFTPVMVSDLVEFVVDAVQNRESGVFHIASLDPVTRYGLACQINDYFQLEVENIATCKINELGLAETRPVNIDLNISKYVKLTGKELKPVEVYLEMIKKNDV